jgi:hypothetical protein
MPSKFTLQRVNAFAVLPQRTSETNEGQGPIGGACSVTTSLASLIQANIQNVRFEAQPEVLFRFDPQTRTCGMRTPS